MPDLTALLDRSCIVGPLLFLRPATRVYTGEIVPRVEILNRTGPPSHALSTAGARLPRSAFGRFPRHAARLERSWDATARHTGPAFSQAGTNFTAAVA
jgi:hypothetical protein